MLLLLLGFVEMEWEKEEVEEDVWLLDPKEVLICNELFRMYALNVLLIVYLHLDWFI